MVARLDGTSVVLGDEASLWQTIGQLHEMLEVAEEREWPLAADAIREHIRVLRDRIAQLRSERAQ